MISIPAWLPNFFAGLLGALLPVLVFFFKQYLKQEIQGQAVKKLHERVDELEDFSGTLRELVNRVEKQITYLEARDEMRGTPVEGVPLVREPTMRFHRKMTSKEEDEK